MDYVTNMIFLAGLLDQFCLIHTNEASCQFSKLVPKLTTKFAKTPDYAASDTSDSFASVLANCERMENIILLEHYDQP